MRFGRCKIRWLLVQIGMDRPSGDEVAKTGQFTPGKEKPDFSDRGNRNEFRNNVKKRGKKPRIDMIPAITGPDKIFEVKISDPYLILTVAPFSSNSFLSFSASSFERSVLSLQFGPALSTRALASPRLAPVT